MNLELKSLRPDPERDRGDVLFIHGVYHAAWAWEKFLSYFTRGGYSSHAMSLRGHGKSEGSAATARFRDYLEDVAQVLNGFEASPVLIGHSLGGMLIQKTIEARDVPAAVLISTPTPTTMRVAGPRLAKRYPLHVLKMLVTVNPDYIYKDRALLRRLFFSPNRSDTDIDTDLDRLLDQNESRRIIWDVSFLRFREPAHSVPVLVIGGSEDFRLDRTNFNETHGYTAPRRTFSRAKLMT